MPEGPEVWILSEAILRYYPHLEVSCHGKQLFIDYGDYIEEYTFGLTGKLEIDDNTNKLTKKQFGFCYGDYSIINNEVMINKISHKLGPSFITMNKEEFLKIIDKWSTTRKMLGSLLLDQSQISGIGVAWGSEILYKAKLNPNKKANEQNLEALVFAFIEIQEYCKSTYMNYLNEIAKEKDDLKMFVNSWYKNLYKVRQMNIYKKGIECKTGGRTWWI